MFCGQTLRQMSRTDGHHARSRWSFWVYHCGRLPPTGGGLLSLFSSWPCRPEGWGLCHGSERYPSQAARDGCSTNQGIPGEDTPPGSAVPWAKAQMEHQHRGQSDGWRGGETGPQTQGSGVQQEGRFRIKRYFLIKDNILCLSCFFCSHATVLERAGLI